MEEVLVRPQENVSPNKELENPKFLEFSGEPDQI